MHNGSMEARDVLVAIGSMVVGLVAGLGAAFISQVMARNTESSKDKEALYARVLTLMKMFPEHLRMTRRISPVLASVGFIERRADVMMRALEQLGLAINQLVLSNASPKVQVITQRLSEQIENLQPTGRTRRAQLRDIARMAAIVDSEFQCLRDAMREDLGRDPWLAAYG